MTRPAVVLSVAFLAAARGVDPAAVRLERQGRVTPAADGCGLLERVQGHPSDEMRGRKRIAGLVVAVLTVAVAVIAVSAQADSRVAYIRDSIAWDDSCASIRTSDNDKSGWTHATKGVAIVCEHLGPMVLYSRFGSDRELRDDLLRRPPSEPTCVAGREVLVDYLDPGQFVALCRRLGGDRIDAVSKLPVIPWDGTVGELDATVDAGERRDTAAQGRALRRYFG